MVEQLLAENAGRWESLRSATGSAWRRSRARSSSGCCTSRRERVQGPRRRAPPRAAGAAARAVRAGRGGRPPRGRRGRRGPPAARVTRAPAGHPGQRAGAGPGPRGRGAARRRGRARDDHHGRRRRPRARRQVALGRRAGGGAAGGRDRPGRALGQGRAGRAGAGHGDRRHAAARASRSTCSSAATLREGARVGTSALRRRAQLLAARPDLEVVELRGNVDTRLAKRAAGEVDVLVLAAAGLDRLGRRAEAGALLTGGVFVPRAGQGVIAVQARAGSEAAAAAAPPTTRRRTPRSTRSAQSCARSARAATRRSACSPLERARARVRRPAGRLRVARRGGRHAATSSPRRLLAAGAAELLARRSRRDRLSRRRGAGRSGPDDRAGARADRDRRRDPLRPADPAGRAGRGARGRRARLRRQGGRRAADAAGGDRPAAGPVRDRRPDGRAAQGRRSVRVRARRRGGAGAARGRDPVRGRAGDHGGDRGAGLRRHPGHAPRARQRRRVRHRPRGRRRSTGRRWPPSRARSSSTWACKALPRIAERLVAGGRPPDEPVAVVERGTLPGQRTVVATLADVAERAAGIRAPAITLVGAVAGAARADRLARGAAAARAHGGGHARAGAGERAAARLRELGAEVVEAPAIRTRPLEVALPDVRGTTCCA